jgi:hypothetical protein
MLDKVIHGLSGLEQRLSRLASHKWQVAVILGLISLLARAALLPWLPAPKPAIQDEFSYLLAADTFAHGRLANPTPPYAEHFETLQELIHPTYASKYPPFSGLMMALGQKLTGVAWVGVWLGMGVLCATVCWALQGWLPPVWALVGGVIALVRIGIVSYWTETYWGGTWAAVGGALVIGAVPRLAKRPNKGVALAFAAGIAILANTRPYEGLLLIIASAIYLIVAWLRSAEPPDLSSIVKSVVLPIAFLLIPVVTWMGYYNYRVTGNALEMPYIAHERKYAMWSPWLWDAKPNTVRNYSNSLLQDFWISADGADKRFSHEHLLKTHFSDLVYLERFYFGWPLVLCMFLFVRPLWRDPIARHVLILLGIFYAGAAIETRLIPHYLAPATALGYVLAACTLRAVRNEWIAGGKERLFVAWAFTAVFVLTTALALFTPENRFLFEHDYHIAAKRANVTEKLQHEPGEHLVLVRYGSRHDLFEEFVYNQSDIEKSPIVWARSLGAEKDEALIHHYSGRDVWVAEEDGEMKLTRYVTSTKGTTTHHFEGSVARQF